MEILGLEKEIRNKEIHSPEISVIMPVYNSEIFLRKSIKSVLNQTFQDFELILIDDGSTDRSLSICKEFLLKDKRITIIEQENKGVSKARNAGLEIAKGNYISFVDSDDIIHPQMIEILHSMTENNKYDISMCLGKLVEADYENESWDFHSLPVKKQIINYDIVTRNLFDAGNIDYQFMVVWNKLFRRTLFENHIFRDTNPEDLDLLYRLTKEAGAINYCDLKLYNWVQHNMSITHQINIYKECLIIKTYYDIYRYYVKADNNKEASWCLLKLYKVILRKRNLFQNSNDSNKIKRYSNIIIKRSFYNYLKNLLNNFPERIIVLFFIFCPVFYSVFIKYHNRKI